MNKPDMSGDREERLAEERFVFLTQALIQRELNKRGLKYRDLARKLGVSEARISQLMGDSAINLSVRTVGRILYRLDETGVVMTQKELDGIAHGHSGEDHAAWVFAAPGEHVFASQETTEIVSAPAAPREAESNWREWAAAEAAADDKRAA